MDFCHVMTFDIPPDPQDIPPELPTAVTRLAWCGAVLVALLVPLVFLLIAYQNEVVRLESALQIGFHSIAKPSSAEKQNNPDIDLQTALASLGWLGDKTGIRIRGADGQVLIEQPGNPAPPLLTRTAPLNLGVEETGQLELSRSLRPLGYFALVMLLPGAMLGAIVFLVLRNLPVRVLRHALREVAIRKTTEEQLAKSLSIFSATLESTADGIFVTDVMGREVVCNQRFRDMWGLRKSKGPFPDNNETLAAMASQLRNPVAFAEALRDLKKNADINHGATLELRDGRRFEWNSQPQLVNGEIVGRVSSFRDISERGRAQALLAVEKNVLEMVVCGNALKAALRVLADHVEVLSGEMFCAIVFRDDSEDSVLACATGRSLPGSVADSIVYQGRDDLNGIFTDISGRASSLAHDLSDEYSGVIEDLDTLPAWAGYHERMARYAIQTCFAVPIRASSGDLLGFIVAHYRHVSKQQPHDRELTWVAANLSSIAIERRQAEERLQVMAHYDALTNLPNRVLFHDRLNQALARAERNKNLVALLFLDLDRFKAVNDTLGHDSGDQLLREVSVRLRQCVREADTVARLGGDEFTLILEQINSPADTVPIAGSIIEILSSPFVLDGQEAFVSPSIGITIYPGDGTSADHLVKNADFAMYRAKEEGGNSYRFFAPEMSAMTIDRLEMESGLRHALERDEFVVYYQPKQDLASGAITGAEALLRWRHPVRGLVSPAEFIPILEETGLIEKVGLWVVTTVCKQIRTWQIETDLPPLVVAVNLSGRQLQRGDLAATLAEIIEEAGIEPSLLELEVTESMLMHDPQCAADLLLQIRSKGILHVDVDDFGTGYSSLSYLKRFPIDCLKLDKSFVDGLPDDEDDAAISRAVIAMAHSLRMKVIAEGVEREEQLAFLRNNGCDTIQGYIVSPPMPADSFARLVQDFCCPAATSQNPQR